MAKKEDDEDEKDKKPRAVIHRYQNRLKILRMAQDYSQKDQIAQAVQFYMQYLEALAAYHEVDEKNLGPELFDKNKDLGEMLLISHVYWDLAKAFDRNPKFQLETVRYLSQFVKFTIGFKYQYINSELIRKFIKKKMSYNPKAFSQAHERIRVHSKKCYVATYCYGEEHQHTNNLRLIKQALVKSNFGSSLVDLYYSVSPRLITFFENHPRIGKFSTIFLKPPLAALSHLARRLLND